jgi:hypothetical protein
MPGIARFISEDPIGWSSGQTNNYAYVGGDPINLIDPLGLEANQNTEDMLAGFGDALTFGATIGLRRIFGINGVNTSSGWYMAGGATAFVAMVVATGGAGAGARAAASAPRAFGGLSRAAEFGIRPYGQLRAALQGTGLQAHHLIEQRLAAVMSQTPREMLSVAVTRAEHQVFTNAWRAAIPYGAAGTGAATTEIVLQAARDIYSSYPAIMQALGL